MSFNTAIEQLFLANQGKREQKPSRRTPFHHPRPVAVSGSYAPDAMAPQNQNCNESAPIPIQIRQILTGRCVFLNDYPSRRVMDERCERINAFYVELQRLGYRMTAANSFARKHAMLLLESWKAKRLSDKTIYKRWCILRGWALALGKYGMLGTLEEAWPEFVRSTLRVAPGRSMTAEQRQLRSDHLKAQSDKTAYLVDRLGREVGMSRAHAVSLELTAVQAFALGGDLLRCGTGPDAKVYGPMQTHQELMREVASFMVERSRTTLGWPGLEVEDAIRKYALRMTYVNSRLFAKPGQPS